MNEQETNKLSKQIINKLDVNDIVYAEIAESGAMGNAGGIILYVLENTKLIQYETSLYDNENYYSDIKALILKHQNGFDHEDPDVEDILYDYHYGGVGNHVFINRKIKLDKEDRFFKFMINNNTYNIHCTVQGVFNAIAYSINNAKEK